MSSLNASRIYPMGMKDTLVQVIQPHVHGYLDGYSASVFETYGYVLMYTSSFPIQTPADIQKVLFVQVHQARAIAATWRLTIPSTTGSWRRGRAAHCVNTS
jgi:hypothetical protein